MYNGQSVHRRRLTAHALSISRRVTAGAKRCEVVVGRGLLPETRVERDCPIHTAARLGEVAALAGVATEIELDGGLMHFLEARMDSSFSTNPLAMQSAIRLMERGVVNPDKVISHRFPLAQIGKALEVMGTPDRNKVVINP